MTGQALSALAVIPARGGSKGIPRKNLQVVGGLSLIARAARVVAAVPEISAGVISTDDEEIAQEAVRHNLLAPFRRPLELAGDRSTSIEVWQHAWRECERIFATRFEISVLLEPTSPLRRAEDVVRTIRTLVESGRAAAATVSRTPAHFTPHKTLTVSERGVIGFYLPEGARYSLRQAIPPYFHRNGVCYAARRETILERGSIIDHDCAAVIIERHVVNVDDPLDLRVADMLAGDEE